MTYTPPAFTQRQKLDLADLFEGCMDMEDALAMLGLDTNPIARRCWKKWQREMDEFGSYIL